MKFFLMVVATLFSNYGFAQSVESARADDDKQSTYQLKIKPAALPIIVDGELSEPAWQEAMIVGDFWQKRPLDGIKVIPQKQTEVRATYNEKFLYISAICYDTNYYVIQSLKRDTRFIDSDVFGVVLDPVNRRSTGFLFAVNPLNVQYEDVLSAATAAGTIPSLSWDNRWYSSVKRFEDHWIVEIAIPYKTLRYEAGKTEWGINFFRQDQKLNEDHSWTSMPVNFRSLDLGYTGLMQWESAPPKAGSNISVNPYVLGSTTTNNTTNTTQGDFKAGVDVKVGITPSLNLDLTVNPDFSSVAVDVQQTNLTRFVLRFPEQRPFFLENADLFGGFGSPNESPFFSRAIGLDVNNQPVPILFGARLSGNVSKNLRVGAMNMHTKQTELQNANNFTAIVFNQAFWSRSFVRGYFHNRQAFNSKEIISNDYSRTEGVEFSFTNLSGKWFGAGSVHTSQKPGYNFENLYYNVQGNYNGRFFTARIDYHDVGTNHYAEQGLFQRLFNRNDETNEVIRIGYKRLYNRLDYTIRPSGSVFNSHQFSMINRFQWNDDRTIPGADGTLSERNLDLQYTGSLRSTAQFIFLATDNDVRLLFPTRFTENPLPAGAYRFQQLNGQWRSDARKSFAYQAGYQFGEFYNGRLNQYTAQVTYRKQPWGNFTLGLTQNNINLPDGYGDANFQLINLRAEINFSTSVFWTTFFQYNTQVNNFNINSRLQWRFKPMSDVYLVYTDNYVTEFPLANKNRGIVLRLNYWLTL